MNSFFFLFHYSFKLHLITCTFSSPTVTLLFFFWVGSFALKQKQFLFYDRHIMTFIPILVLFFFQTSETCMSYFSAKKPKEALLQCLHTTTRWNEKEAEHPLWDFDLDAGLILCGMQMLPRMPPPTEELHIIKYLWSNIIVCFLLSTIYLLWTYVCICKDILWATIMCLCYVTPLCCLCLKILLFI